MTTTTTDTNTMNTKDMIAAAVSRSLLVDLTIRTYSGRKQDKRTQEEVTTAKGAASKQAASVYKSLFADCKELADITKYQARARQDHYRYTKPWTDSGTRQLPIALLTEYNDTMRDHEREFYSLVDKFLDKYETLVAAAAFQLGTLFDRSEYPSRGYVRKCFSFDVQISPMPTSGDFRLDIESEAQRELAQAYEERMERMLEKAQQDSWQRLYDALSSLSDRLTDGEDGKKRKFHDTLVYNAEQVCTLLTAMNVTGDPALEKARYRLQDAIDGVTPMALRTEDYTRKQVKTKVDGILADFDWGIEDDEDEDEGGEDTGAVAHAA